MATERNTFRLIIETADWVGVTLRGEQCTIGRGGKQHELYRAGSWVIESLKKGNQYDLMCVGPIGSGLTIDFRSGMANVSFAGATERKEYKNIRRFLISDEGTASVEYIQPDIDEQAIINREREAKRQEIEGLLAQLEQQKKQTQMWKRQCAAAEEREVAAIAEKEQAQTDKANMERMLAGTLEQRLDDIRGQSSQLSTELQRLESEIAEAEGELAAKEARNAERRNQLEQLQNRIDATESAFEDMYELDCPQARAKMNELQTRLQMDENVQDLMQEEAFLKGNSVRETLEQIEQELEAVENRLGKIIRLREKINSGINDAILKAEGTILLSEELGGNQDGDSSGAEVSDQTT